MFERYITRIREYRYQKKGIKFLSLSKFEKALFCFEKAILLNNSVQNIFYYSISLIALNRHLEAVSYLEPLMNEYSVELLISTTLLDCYLVLKEYDKANCLLDNLIVNYSDNTLLQKFYTIIKDPVLREKYSLSKEFFYQSIKYEKEHNYEAGYTAIKTAIELDKNNATYHYTAGNLLLKAKKPKEDYVKYFEKAVILAPQNEMYKKQLRHIKLMSK